MKFLIGCINLIQKKLGGHDTIGDINFSKIQEYYIESCFKANMLDFTGFNQELALAKYH